MSQLSQCREVMFIAPSLNRPWTAKENKLHAESSTLKFGSLCIIVSIIHLCLKLSYRYRELIGFSYPRSAAEDLAICR